MEVNTRPEATEAEAREESRLLHYVRTVGQTEAILAGDPFIYRSMCGDSWVSDPGDLGYLPTDSERAAPLICDTCQTLYNAMVWRSGRRQ